MNLSIQAIETIIFDAALENTYEMKKLQAINACSSNTFIRIESFIECISFCATKLDCYADFRLFSKQKN